VHRLHHLVNLSLFSFTIKNALFFFEGTLLRIRPHRLRYNVFTNKPYHLSFRLEFVIDQVSEVVKESEFDSARIEGIIWPLLVRLEETFNAKTF